MSIEIALQEIYDALKGLGIPISEELSNIITISIACIIVITILVNFFKLLATVLQKIFNKISPLFYNPDNKEFIRIRNVFVQYLVYEIQRMNREADWNDIFYTELEAEVEVDPDINYFVNSSHLVNSLKSIFFSIRGIIRRPSLKLEKSLIKAIIRSKSRAFLVIGDPGSGKTVSLRQLFLKIAEKSSKSNNKSVSIPIYLNLKHLDISSDNISQDSIHSWVIKQIENGQDRIIHNFLEDHFEELLSQGNFFFIFDSFDEIPSVMDAREEGETVQKYAKALEGFLNGPHQCKGLVCSRPYRAPKIFMGQRMTIRPLSSKLVEATLKKYLLRKKHLAQQAWYETIRNRVDLLQVIKTPFYLSLLAKYIEANEQLPNKHYDLFEEFVTNRAHSDKERLNTVNLTQDQLLCHASLLAYQMTLRPMGGLEITVTQAQELLLGQIDEDEVLSVLTALNYCKLGKITAIDPLSPGVFGFAHRRFQEYFVARYIKNNSMSAPFNELASDNRWREVLVLLCEVLPIDQLEEVFKYSQKILNEGVIAPSGSEKQIKANECMSFLKDGFLSRMNELPEEIRLLATRFIFLQFDRNTLSKRLRIKLSLPQVNVNEIIEMIEKHILDKTLLEKIKNSPPTSIEELVNIVTNFNVEKKKGKKKHKNENNGKNMETEDIIKTINSVLSPSGNLLDQKRAIENLPLADVQSAPNVVELALNSDSDWIQETALRSCRILISPSEQILKTIRVKLRNKYFNLTLNRDSSMYQILFSTNSSFVTVKEYLWVLKIVGIITISYLSIIGITLIFANPIFVINFIFFTLEFWMLFGEKKHIRKYMGSVVVISIFCAILMVMFKSTSFFSNLVNLFIPVLILNIFVNSISNKYPSTIFGWFFSPLIVVYNFIKELNIIIPTIKIHYKKIIKFFFGMGILGGLAYSSILIGNRLLACNFSLNCIYITNNILISILSTIYEIIIIIFAVLIVFILIKLIWETVSDPLLLRMMVINPKFRPISTTDALRKLNSFKTVGTQIEYIRNLRNWLPVASDWQILIEGSIKYDGIPRDELYKLAELWQDYKK